MNFWHAPTIKQTAAEDGLSFLIALQKKGKTVKRFMKTERAPAYVEWLRLSEVKLSTLLESVNNEKPTNKTRDHLLLSACELMRTLRQSLEDSAEGNTSDIVVMNNIHLYRMVASLVVQLAMYDEGDSIGSDAGQQLDDFRTLVTSLNKERYKVFMHASSATDHEIITKVGGVIGKSILGNLAAVASGVVALDTETFAAAGEGIVGFLNISDTWDTRAEVRTAATCNALSQRLKYLLLVSTLTTSDGTQAPTLDVHLVSLVKKIHGQVCPEGTSLSLPASLWAGTLADLLVFSRVVVSKPSNKAGEESLVHSNGVLYHRLPMLGEQQGVTRFPGQMRETMVTCLVNLLKRGRVTPGRLTTLLAEGRSPDLNEEAKKRTAIGVRETVAALLGTIGANSAKIRHRAVLACYEVIESGELDGNLAEMMGREVLDTVRSDGEGALLVSQMKAFRHTEYYLNILLKGTGCKEEVPLNETECRFTLENEEDIKAEAQYNADNAKLQDEVGAYPDPQVANMSQHALELYKHNLAVLATIGLLPDAVLSAGPQLPARNGLQDITKDTLSFLRGLESRAKDVAQCAEARDRVARLQTFVKWFKLNEVKLSSLLEVQWGSKLAAEYMLVAVCELLRALRQSLGDSDTSDIVVMNNIHLYRMVASLVVQLAMYDEGDSIGSDAGQQLDEFRALVTSLNKERYKVFMHASSATDHEIITKVGGVIGKSILGNLAAVASGVVALKTMGFDTETFAAAGEGIVGFLNISDTWDTRAEVRTAATCNALSQRLKYLLLVSTLTTSDGTQASEYLVGLVKKIHEEVCPEDTKALPASLWVGTLADLLVFSRVVSSEQTERAAESLVHSNGVLYQRIPVEGEQQGVTQFPGQVREAMVDCLLGLLKRDRKTPSYLKAFLEKATKLLGGVQKEARKILKAEEVMAKLGKIFNEEKITGLKDIAAGVEGVVAGLTASSGGDEGTSVRHRAVLACYEVVESGELDCKLAKEMSEEVLDTVRSENGGRDLEQAGRVFGKARQYLKMTLRTKEETYKKDMEGLLGEVEMLLELRRVVPNKEAEEHVDNLLTEAQKAVKVYAANLEGLNAIAGTTLLLTASIFNRVAGIDRQLQDMKKEVSDIHSYLQLHRKLDDDIDLLHEARTSCGGDLHLCDKYSFIRVLNKGASEKVEPFSPKHFVSRMKDHPTGSSFVCDGTCWGRGFLSLVEKELWCDYYKDATDKSADVLLLPLHVFLPAMKEPTTRLIEEALMQHGFTMGNVQRLQERTRGANGQKKVHLVLILVGYSFLDKEFHLDSMRKKNRLGEWGGPTILVAADTAILECPLNKVFACNSSFCIVHNNYGEERVCEEYGMCNMERGDVARMLGAGDASIGSVLRSVLLYRKFAKYIEHNHETQQCTMTLAMLMSVTQAIHEEDTRDRFWSVPYSVYDETSGQWTTRNFPDILTANPVTEDGKKLVRETYHKMLPNETDEPSHEVVMYKLADHVLKEVESNRATAILAQLDSYLMKPYGAGHMMNIVNEKEINTSLLRTCLEEYFRLSLKELNTKHPSISDGDLVSLMMRYNALLAVDMTRGHSLQAPYGNAACIADKLDPQLVRDLFAASPLFAWEADNERVYSFYNKWMQEAFTAIAVHDNLMQVPLNRCCTKFFVSFMSQTDTGLSLNAVEQNENRWAYFRRHKNLMVMKVKCAIPSITEEEASKYLVGACKAACMKQETWNVLMEDLKNYPDTLRLFLAKMVRKKNRTKGENKLLVWFRDTLYSLVELSKLPWCKVPAAVAITILSAANDSFAGMDLRGIRVKGAYLEDSTFDRTNITNDELQGTHLSRAYLMRDGRLHLREVQGTPVGENLLSFAAFTDDNGTDIVAEVYTDRVMFGDNMVTLPDNHQIPAGTTLLSRIVRRGASRVLVVAYKTNSNIVIMEVARDSVKTQYELGAHGKLVKITRHGEVCYVQHGGTVEFLTATAKNGPVVCRKWTGKPAFMKSLCLVDNAIYWLENGALNAVDVKKKQSLEPATQKSVYEYLTPMSDRLLAWSYIANRWVCTVCKVAVRELGDGRESLSCEEIYSFPMYQSSREKKDVPRHVVSGRVLLTMGRHRTSNFCWLLKEKSATRLYTRAFGDGTTRINVLNTYASAAKAYYHMDGNNNSNFGLICMKLPKSTPILKGAVRKICVSHDGGLVGTLVECGDDLKQQDVVVYCRATGTLSRLKEPVDMAFDHIGWDKGKQVFTVESGHRVFETVSLGPETMELKDRTPEERVASDPVQPASRPPRTHVDQLVYEDSQELPPFGEKLLKSEGGRHTAWVYQGSSLIVCTDKVTKLLLESEGIVDLKLAGKNLVALTSGGNAYIWRWRHGSQAQYGYTPAGSTGEWYISKRLTIAEIVNVAPVNGLKE